MDSHRYLLHQLIYPGNNKVAPGLHTAQKHYPVFFILLAHMGAAHVFENFPFAVHNAHPAHAASAAAASVLYRTGTGVDHRPQYRLVTGAEKNIACFFNGY
jgi:hypothetical protein